MTVRGPRGSIHWSDGTIHHILTNPVYTGTVYAGRNHYRPATGRISPLKPVGGGNGSIDPVPPEDWIVVAQIAAIVSQEQFEVVQEKLKHNQSIASRNNKKHQYLLRAMVSCGLCQLACTGRTTDTGHAYYACNGKRPLLQSPRMEKCPSRLLPVGQLDELVWADVCEVLLHPECLALALQRAQGGQWLPAQGARECRTPNGTLDRGVSGGRGSLGRIQAATARTGTAVGRPRRPTASIGSQRQQTRGVGRNRPVYGGVLPTGELWVRTG